MVAAGVKEDIGNASLVSGISQDTIEKTQAIIKRGYERICDLMKTSQNLYP